MADYSSGIADGHGQDLVLYDGDIVGGNFVNMGHVIVSPGATVKLLTPGTDSGTFLRIWAKSITVRGILDGSGQGFGGGAGAGANFSLTSAYGRYGSGGLGGDYYGGPGEDGKYLTAIGQTGAVGGLGGGPEAWGTGVTASGGLPGSPAHFSVPEAQTALNGGHGGYLGRGINGDVSTDEIVYPGGAGGGGSSSARHQIITVGSYNLAAGAAGAQGGYGGALMAFYANQIVVDNGGQILSRAKKGSGAGGSSGVAGAGGGGRIGGVGGVFGGYVGGTGGSAGMAGFTGSDGPGLYLGGASAGPGEGGWMAGNNTHTPPVENGYDVFRGGNGGEGAGGGILFKVYPSLTCGPQILIRGRVDNHGGLGATNGGTFKCFYTGRAVLPAANIFTGRLYAKKSTKAVSTM